MLKIRLITVGGLKEAYWRQAQEEYLKRLSRFAAVQIIQPEEARLPADPTPGEVARALEKEGADILNKLRPNGLKVALCVEGQEMSSPEYAAFLEHAAVNGSVDFIIGSSYGLADSVKKACDKRISFSKMTFPHQMMRVIWLEQTYRAFKINARERYHK